MSVSAFRPPTNLDLVSLFPPTVHELEIELIKWRNNILHKIRGGTMYSSKEYTYLLNAFSDFDVHVLK